MPSPGYKNTTNKLGQKMYYLHTSSLASELENTNLTLKISKLEERIHELTLEKLVNSNLKDIIEYLENKKKCNIELEESLRS